VTWYTFFKFVHIAAVTIWVGGAVMIQALAFRIVRSRDSKRQADFARDTEVVGMRVFIPTTWILLLAGIAMMINADWAWDQNWIIFGLIAFALSFVVGAGFLGPEGGRIAALIEKEGYDSPAALARIRRILLISRCELVILLTVIWSMVVKPVGNDGWFWGSLLVMLAGIVAVVVAYRRAEQAVPAPATE
jgi:uncharacterized membrane protein